VSRRGHATRAGSKKTMCVGKEQGRTSARDVSAAFEAQAEAMRTRAGRPCQAFRPGEETRRKDRRTDGVVAHGHRSWFASLFIHRSSFSIICIRLWRTTSPSAVTKCSTSGGVLSETRWSGGGDHRWECRGRASRRAVRIPGSGTSCQYTASRGPPYPAAAGGPSPPGRRTRKNYRRHREKHRALVAP